MRLKPENCLTLAIDYQERLVPPVEDRETLIKNSRILLEGLGVLGLPLIVSRQYPEKLGDSIPEIKEVTGPGLVLDKTDFSCYQDPALKEAIDRTGRKTVIICGVEAHICVLQTCVDLAEAGFQVVVPADCVGSRRGLDKKYGLKRLVQEGCLAATYESILFELTVGKSSSAFKDISRLVK